MVIEVIEAMKAGQPGRKYNVEEGGEDLKHLKKN